MGENVDVAADCLTEACKAAKKKDKARLRQQLYHLNSLDILQQLQRDSIMDLPPTIQKPTLKEQLPKWMQQVIKDQGLAVGKDIFLKKGPGKVGIKLEIQF